MKKAALARLGQALEAKKLRDAGRLAEARASLEALESEARAIRAQLAAMGPQTATMADLAVRDRWRSGQRARLEAIAASQVERRVALSAAAETLRRSNGEAEAAARLLGALRKRPEN